MRRKNFDEMFSDERHKDYFSGEEDRYKFGVGFLVHKDMESAVVADQSPAD